MIHGVTISRFGYEFILHVPEEYDYRYSCLDLYTVYFVSLFSRDKILEALADCYYRLFKRKMAFYLTDELNLNSFCTSKVDGKKNISRIPSLEPLVQFS